MKNREEIVVDAFRKLGIPGDGDLLTADQTTAGVRAFTSMVKAFQAKHGLPLWKTENLTFGMSLLAGGSALLSNSGTLQTTDKVTKVNNIWRKRDDQVVMLTRQPNDRFTSLSNNAQESTPNEYKLDERKDGFVVTVWPVPDAQWVLNGELIISVTSRFTETLSDLDTPDFPDHWEEALIYGLALRLAPEYSIALDRHQILGKEAQAALDNALYEDADGASVFFQPDRRW